MNHLHDQKITDVQLVHVNNPLGGDSSSPAIPFAWKQTKPSVIRLLINENHTIVGWSL